MTKSVFLLLGEDPAFRALAKSAAKLIDAECIIEEPASFNEACRRPVGADQLVLVIDRPSADGMARAVEATDDDGSPRWATVFTGAPQDAPGCAGLVPQGADDAVTMARCLSSAIWHHRLQRENHRLRGDLKTIGRRVNHDIRTQLGGIVSTADLLRDVLPVNDPEPPELVQSLVDSVGKVLILLDRVKAIVMTSDDIPVMEDILAGDVAMAEGQRLSRQLLERGAAITQPDSWPAVGGPHAWLKAIWGNLLTNALQHAGHGVTIETGWRKESEFEYRFWVRDNGPGVPPGRRATLFPSFHSLHELSGGHGLGLAIVKRLTERMGGRCGYDPSPSGGACFWFTLAAGTRAGSPSVGTEPSA